MCSDEIVLQIDRPSSYNQAQNKYPEFKPHTCKQYWQKVCMASTAVDEEEAATWSSILIVDITDLRDSKIKVHHLYQ